MFGMEHNGIELEQRSYVLKFKILVAHFQQSEQVAPHLLFPYLSSSYDIHNEKITLEYACRRWFSFDVQYTFLLVT